MIYSEHMIEHLLPSVEADRGVSIAHIAAAQEPFPSPIKTFRVVFAMCYCFQVEDSADTVPLVHGLFLPLCNSHLSWASAKLGGSHAKKRGKLLVAAASWLSHLSSGGLLLVAHLWWVRVAEALLTSGDLWNSGDAWRSFVGIEHMQVEKHCRNRKVTMLNAEPLCRAGPA